MPCEESGVFYYKTKATSYIMFMWLPGHLEKRAISSKKTKAK